MTTRPRRIIDAHVHLWDPARSDWYPYLSGQMSLENLNMDDPTGMARRFDVPTYRSESDGWNVEKVVNVAAAVGRYSVDETLEIDMRAEAEGGPHAIVGGIVPTGSLAEAEELLDRQMSAARFRGVRPMGAFEGPLPATEVLAAVRDRGLVFELMAHADQLLVAAEGLDGLDDLTVVVEHTGWPRSDTPEERKLWEEGMAALASLGDNVVCKLSGLAMPLGSMSPEVLAPWIEHAIEVFGVDRCLFASNFPVDGMHGSLDELFSAFTAVTAGLDEESVDKLFAANAERIYRPLAP